MDLSLEIKIQLSRCCTSPKYFLTDLESGVIGCCEIHGPIIALPSPSEPNQNVPVPKGRKHWHDCPELHKAVEGAAFIADYIKKEEEEKKIKEDWKYVAMVLDRLFLWIFTLAVTMGSAGIILQAPTLYDNRLPINLRLSEILAHTPTVKQNYNNIM